MRLIRLGTATALAAATLAFACPEALAQTPKFVWFGPTAPPGREGNWVQTWPSKGFNVLLRLYAPLEPWFGKTWRPGDLELAK